MKMKTSCCIAFLALCSGASAQQGAWEDWFHFGPSQQDRIVAVNLIHTYNGSSGKFLALTFQYDFSCKSVRARLWTPPPIGASGPGTFEPPAGIPAGPRLPTRFLEDPVITDVGQADTYGMVYHQNTQFPPDCHGPNSPLAPTRRQNR